MKRQYHRGGATGNHILSATSDHAHHSAWNIRIIHHQSSQCLATSPPSSANCDKHREVRQLEGAISNQKAAESKNIGWRTGAEIWRFRVNHTHKRHKRIRNESAAIIKPKKDTE